MWLDLDSVMAHRQEGHSPVWTLVAFLCSRTSVVPGIPPPRAPSCSARPAPAPSPLPRRCRRDTEAEETEQGRPDGRPCSILLRLCFRYFVRMTL